MIVVDIGGIDDQLAIYRSSVEGILLQDDDSIQTPSQQDDDSIQTPSQPVWALSREAANTNILIPLCLSWPGIEPKIYHTSSRQHTSHYITEEVH